MNDNLERLDRAVEWEPPLWFWAGVIMVLYFLMAGMYSTFIWAFNMLGW